MYKYAKDFIFIKSSYYQINSKYFETIDNLIKKNTTVSTAESMTGGLISSSITECSGASNIFSLGLVCYSEEMKIKMLGVNSETIIKYGVVSKECAYEMLKGIYNFSKTDICISVTGFAGPSGSDKFAEIGDVYIGIKVFDKCYIYYIHLKYDRNFIRKYIVSFAFDKISNILKNIE